VRTLTLLSLTVALYLTAGRAPQDEASLAATLRRLAADTPGTAGVSVVHIESGAAAAVNGEGRFPMMSVYKLPIVVHALREAERGRLDLADTVTLTAGDRRPGASEMGETIATTGPLTVTVRDIVVAVATKSDNTASDWLLRRIGGPRAVAATLRSLKLPGIDISRYELEFSADYNGFCCVARMTPFSLEKYADAIDALPEAVRAKAAKAYESDPRDAATPVGFTGLLTHLQRRQLLNETSTAWLLGLMEQMHARDGRIRAGLPAGTRVALRPGTSGLTGGVRAAQNDTGIVTLPGGRGHLAIAVFLKGADGTDEARDAAIARFARAAYEWAMASNLFAPRGS
jgi:beta-lactamase class A